MRRLFTVLLGLVLIVAGGLTVLVMRGPQGELEQPGVVRAPERSAQAVATRVATDQAAAVSVGAQGNDQILFGDLHVHSTYSVDAFLWSMPIMHGSGLHPPADACDYARYCSSLDFWSLTDHAEALTPRHWRDTQQMVRDCNGQTNPENPDLVTFLGWEWTQVGQTPQDHYGHRNIVVKETAADKVPPRPITSGGLPLKHMRRRTMSPLEEVIAPYLYDEDARPQLRQQFAKQEELRSVPYCPEGLDTRDLPVDCVESAETPEKLWEKFHQWGGEVLAIPHGTTWGFYTPPGTRFDKQLTKKQYDPQFQRLVEVFSGHGNSEEYRDFRAVEFDDAGNASCPEPSQNYLPCCYQAGVLIRERCDDPASAECEARVAKAQMDYLDASVGGHLVVPGAKPEEWLNCGQCNDCTMPALNYRPGNSVQAMMTLSDFENPESDGDPERFQFGFVASSDNHAAQPGTGFKQVGRHQVTEVFGPADELTRARFSDVAKRSGRGPESIPFDRRGTHYNLFQYSESERLGSFFYTGGLVAVHASDRTRDAIWDGLENRQTYATSGQRMLLWFDLLNGPDGDVGMGGEAKTAEIPRFRVRAVGAFEQLPGCPQASIDALGAERVQSLCGGECDNPGDVRKPIERIEVIRIRPRVYENEDQTGLIDDPWKVIDCEPSQSGCVVEFEDPDYSVDERDTLYYVRALQPPEPTINGDTLRCENDAEGNCKKVNICYGDERTALTDDCLAPVAPRAWSSPIYLDYPQQRVAAAELE